MIIDLIPKNPNTFNMQIYIHRHTCSHIIRTRYWCLRKMISLRITIRMYRLRQSPSKFRFDTYYLILFPILVWICLKDFTHRLLLPIMTSYNLLTLITAVFFLPNMPSNLLLSTFYFPWNLFFLNFESKLIVHI